ncbi:hypothetical protein BRADI_2g13153v3 [Brachypodium distachyon]|uniref:Uncharacterized protein n=1 Tax=Brachypodium distachyon TaxID=15368 RepID=A0A0Q3QSA0_BRADI|nr:hypothetical protein BRADI_2g13153v3 [Brachypodium distachyon]
MGRGEIPARLLPTTMTVAAAITFLKASLWLDCGFLLLWHQGKPLVWLTDSTMAVLQRRSPLLRALSWWPWSPSMSMVVVDDECRFHAWDNGPLGAMDPLVDASWTISFLSSGLLLP